MQAHSCFSKPFTAAWELEGSAAHRIATTGCYIDIFIKRHSFEVDRYGVKKGVACPDERQLKCSEELKLQFRIKSSTAENSGISLDLEWHEIGPTQALLVRTSHTPIENEVPIDIICVCMV